MTPSRAEKEELVMSFRVVTWNLGGAPPEFSGGLEDEMRAAGASILGMQPLPDFVSFQEVFFPANLAHLSDALRSEYDPIVPPEAATKSGVPWPLLIVPPLVLSPLAYLWRLRQGGLVSFVRRDGPWEVRSKRFRRFTKEACSARLYEGDGYADKGIHETVLGRDSQPELVILNTHVQAQYLFRHRRYREVRIAQIRQVRALAEAHAPLPVIALGDFNTRPDEADAFGEVASFWQDLTVKAGRRPAPATTLGSEKHAPAWIDYVFGRAPAGAAFGVSDVGIVAESRETPISDHRGVYADLEIPAAQVGRAVPLGSLALAALAGPSTRRAWLAAAAVLAADGVGRLLPLPSSVAARPGSPC
jgi:hypothetical protein